MSLVKIGATEPKNEQKRNGINRGGGGGGGGGRRKERRRRRKRGRRRKGKRKRKRRREKERGRQMSVCAQQQASSRGMVKRSKGDEDTQ